MEGLLFKLLEPLWSTASTAEMIDKLARTPLSKIIVISAVLTVLRIALYKYLKDTPQHQRFGVFKVAKWVDSFSDAVVYAAVVVFMLVRPFVARARQHKKPSRSRVHIGHDFTDDAQAIG